MTAAIAETKNKTNGFEAGTAKKLRPVPWPAGRRNDKNRRMIEVIVVKAAPSTVMAIAAGRRTS